jgi:hypothetical protein
MRQGYEGIVVALAMLVVGFAVILGLKLVIG